MHTTEPSRLTSSAVGRSNTMPAAAAMTPYRMITVWLFSA